MRNATNRHSLAVTTPATGAGKKLTSWDAVEAVASRIVEASHQSELSGNFAEIYFNGARIQGVIKAGDVVLKIEA